MCGNYRGWRLYNSWSSSALHTSKDGSICCILARKGCPSQNFQSFHFCFAQNIMCSYLLVLFCHILLCGQWTHLWALSMPLWENPHPNFNYNLIVMWKALIVNGFWWNLNMLFILVVSNSLGNLFEINQSLLNCCVVKKVAFVISRSCSAPQCGGYLRDLALFDQPL